MRPPFRKVARGSTSPGKPAPLAQAPSWRGIETLAQARTENLRRIDALSDRTPQNAAAMEGCDPESPCRLVVCAVCSRHYRVRLIRELLAIAESSGGQHEVATIYLGTFPAGTLATANIKREHERLRQWLRRGGFAGSRLIGGTEVDWDNATRSWTLHVHVLAIGVPPAVWKSLRKALRGIGPKFPVKVELLRDPERQISYSNKFITYFRPRQRGGAAPSPAVPLPPDRLVELASWWAKYSFEDFTFLFGARRRGGRIFVER
jgi:hypothetical protein